MEVREVRGDDGGVYANLAEINTANMMYSIRKISFVQC